MPKGARDVNLGAWIDAPPEKVYRALTGGKELARWFAAKADSDARPGGRLALTWRGIGTGEYRFLKLAPGREVAFSWEKGCRIAFRLMYLGNLECVLERHWDLREDQPRGSSIA